MNAFEAPSGYEAWRDIPSTYIFTSEDRPVPPAYQRLMTDKVKAAGVTLEEHHFETSHSIFLTRTEELVRLVQQASARPTAGTSVDH